MDDPENCALCFSEYESWDLYHCQCGQLLCWRCATRPHRCRPPTFIEGVDRPASTTTSNAKFKTSISDEALGLGKYPWSLPT